MQFNFRDQMDRWGWIATVIALSLFFLRMFWGREAFCGATDEQCVREWISAIGGYAAIAVAIPTFAYLAKQIGDADRHHKTSMTINLRRLRSIAAIMHHSNSKGAAHAAEVIEQLNNTDDAEIPHVFDRRVLMEGLKGAIFYCDDRNVEAFEAEIYVPINPASEVKRMLQELQKTIDKIPLEVDAAQSSEMKRAIILFHRIFKSYLDDVSANAVRFLEDTKEYAIANDRASHS